MEALSVSTSSAETKQDLKVTQQTTPAGAPTRRRQERLASDRALVISWRDARGVLRHTSGRVNDFRDQRFYRVPNTRSAEQAACRPRAERVGFAAPARASNQLHARAAAGRFQWPPDKGRQTRRVEEGRLTGTYWQPVVSLPRSSNRTCPFRASGFPTDFTN